MEHRKEELIECSRKLKQEKLVSTGCNKGSISLRIDEDKFLITPSKIDYDTLIAENINVMCISGDVFEKNAPISRDTYFHVAIYETYKDVNAIIHTHSNYATALALIGRGIPLVTVGMQYHFKGDVRVVPFYMPDHTDFNGVIVRGLAGRNALILKNHGVICTGKSIQEAYENALYLEHLSESYVHAISLGQVESIEALVSSGFSKIKGGK